MIIGLTGPNASGKGEAANYLISKGFRYISLSDILREEAKKRDIRPSRENLILIGNRIRKEKGPSILARKAIRYISKQKTNWVVDSIRNPAEIRALQKIKGFVLLGITASPEIRFKRSLLRKREGDVISLREFIEKEKMENASLPENQQLKNCLKKADIVITNDSTLRVFYKRLDEALKKIQKTGMG